VSFRSLRGAARPRRMNGLAGDVGNPPDGIELTACQPWFSTRSRGHQIGRNRVIITAVGAIRGRDIKRTKTNAQR